MSEKNMEMMKKFLENKKQQQNKNNTQRPEKKIGSGQGAKKNQKPGGSNNKV